MPVDKNGVINGYDKRCCGAEQHVTDKMTEAQLFAYCGDWLFIEIMTDQVFFSHKKSCTVQKVQSAFGACQGRMYD